VVQLPDDDLLCAFFAGEREGIGDTAIWLARRQATCWRKPTRLFAEDGLAHWNPVLHRDGNRIWLFYKVGPTVHSWITRVAISEDGGASWAAPRPLVPADPLSRGPVKNKLIRLSDGTWLAPGSIETDQYWDAFVDRSSDGGANWQKVDVPIEHLPPVTGKPGETWQGLADNALWETDLGRVFRWDGVIQPTLWESSPGQTHMLLRSTRGRIFRSDSADYGRNWCPAYATELPNNNSGIDLVRMDDGLLVLAFNPIAGNWGSRSPLSLAWSTDNGKTWSAPTNLEEDAGEFSYPAIIAEGKTLHVTYTCDRHNIAYRCVRVS
jgi:predicted neuraminidase